VGVSVGVLVGGGKVGVMVGVSRGLLVLVAVGSTVACGLWGVHVGARSGTGGVWVSVGSSAATAMAGVGTGSSPPGPRPNRAVTGATRAGCTRAATTPATTNKMTMTINREMIFNSAPAQDALRLPVVLLVILSLQTVKI